MIIIGVLGDIGSGKSYVAKQFGCPVFNADNEVKRIYENEKKCFNNLKKKLPRYISSFPIKKNELAKAILKDKNNIIKINKIVHPFVRKKMNKFINKNKNKKIVVLDIPLLLENNIQKKSYVLIFIEANKKEIIKRLKKRTNFNLELFNIIRKLQLPLEYKKKKSNFIIKNNFKILSVKKSVRFIKSKIFKK